MVGYSVASQGNDQASLKQGLMPRTPPSQGILAPEAANATPPPSRGLFFVRRGHCVTFDGLVRRSGSQWQRTKEPRARAMPGGWSAAARPRLLVPRHPEVLGGRHAGGERAERQHEPRAGKSSVRKHPRVCRGTCILPPDRGSLQH